MKFIVKDIIEYEQENNISILDRMACADTCIILDMICMGEHCSLDNAVKIYEEATKNNSVEQIIDNIVYEMLGDKPDDTDIDENNTTNNFKNMTEILDHYFESIKLVDKYFTLTEFWGLDTRYILKYAKTLRERFIQEKNMELASQYNEVGMIMKGLAGKLGKCPQINGDENKLTMGNLKEKLQTVRLNK